MRIALCDDEARENEHLAALIDAYARKMDYDIHCEAFTDGKTLLKQPKFDLYFLDFKMDGMDGIAVANALKERFNQAVTICYLTNYESAAAEIINHRIYADGFLKKPVEDVKLRQTLQDIQLMKASHKGIMIRSAGEEIVVVPSEILFLESDNNNVRIITSSGSYTTRMKLGEAIETFNKVNDTIRKVHRCSAVNLDHVARLREREAVLDDGSIIGISRSCFAEFKSELYEHVKRTAR